MLFLLFTRLFPFRFQAVIASCVHQHGKKIISTLLFAASDVLARDLLRILASTLYSVITGYSNFASNCVMEYFSDPNCPLFVRNSVGQAEAKLFCEITFRQPPLPRKFFEAMILDFAMLCRREGTIDLLLAYQF